MSYDISRLRFLIAEDNVAIATLFRSLLTGLGVKVIAVAPNGEAAKQRIIKFKPDIVITDFKMAPGSGIDLTRWLRRSPDSPDNEIAVIMTSAYSEAARVVEARDAGVNEFLVKPVTVLTLYQRIQSLIDSNHPFVRAATYVGPCRRRNKRADYAGPLRRASDLPAAAQSKADVEELSI